jgi:hypothetical protein
MKEKFGGGKYKNTCYQNVVLQLLHRAKILLDGCL